MEVVCGYDWFLAACKDEGLNPKWRAVRPSLELAKHEAVEIKKLMDYWELNPYLEGDGIQAEIDRRHNVRIEFMFQALEIARVIKVMGGNPADDFVAKHTEKMKKLE